MLVIEGPGKSSVSAATLGPGQGLTSSHVPVGRYKLLVGGTGGTSSISKWVEVGSQDVTVKLPIQNAPEVAAEVLMVDGGTASLRGAMLAIQGFADVTSNLRPIPPDGRVTFAPMASGRYQVILQSPRLYVKSVVVRNARMVEGLVELPEELGRWRSISWWRRMARLSAGTSNAGGRPLSAATGSAGATKGAGRPRRLLRVPG